MIYKTSDRFMRALDGRLIDTGSMDTGGVPLISNADGTAPWVPFEGIFGALREASWLTGKEVKDLFGDIEE